MSFQIFMTFFFFGLLVNICFYIASETALGSMIFIAWTNNTDNSQNIRKKCVISVCEYASASQ